MPSSPLNGAGIGTSNADHFGLEELATPLDDRVPLLPVLPASTQLVGTEKNRKMILELQDGTLYQGFSFGADRSIAGEMVFQTGMVGYPESITDPSYRGQILIICYPLVGNYGAPSRDAMDNILESLPAHFEAVQIHIAGMVVASYAGEKYSHHLASSSLGTWLKEQQVPAIYGVDSRALTKKIREQGSMLGRMLLEKNAASEGFVSTNGDHVLDNSERGAYTSAWRNSFENIDWLDPNQSNLVAQGKLDLHIAFYNISNTS